MLIMAAPSVMPFESNRPAAGTLLVGGVSTGQLALLDGLPSHLLRELASWTAEQYGRALDSLAELHAAWWNCPPGFLRLEFCLESAVAEARDALLQIEAAPWGERFLPRERLHAWLNALDNPACLLDILLDMPQTAIYGDNWSGNIPRDSLVGQPHTMESGPALYDVACLYSSVRWWFGRVPLSMSEMRSYYHQSLNRHLGLHLDRYFFDMGFDAALAWRFALHWPALLLEQPISLLATHHHLQEAVIEPAFASLRRIAIC